MENPRPLQASDKEDVLEIAKHTWEGHDYLPYYFDVWIKDVDSHPTAIEKDGHVVALANLRVIEDGRTGWMEGLRVHPNYRGQGLASILTHHVVKMAKDIPVERVRYTTAVGNKTSLHLGQSVRMSRKLELAIHWQDRLDEVSWVSSVHPIKEVCGEEIYSQLLASNLLPFDVLIYDWKALDVSRKSLEKIGILARFWAQIVDDQLASFSLGFVREDPSGPQWSYTIYARDGTSFLDQLSHHLMMASDTECNSLFMTYQPEFVETFHSLEWARPIEDEEMSLTLLEKIL